MNPGLRVTVRVKPGSSKPRVAGRYGEGELVVAVAPRPVDGAANSALKALVAKAFGVAPRDVEVMLGATARTKVLHISGDPEVLTARLDELLRLS